MSAAGEALARALASARIRIDFPELESAGVEGPFFAMPLKMREISNYRPGIRREDNRVWGQIVRNHLEDDSGNKLFDSADEMFFEQELPHAVVERVAGQIWDASSASFEEALKNSKATSDSTGGTRSLTSAA